MTIDLAKYRNLFKEEAGKLLITMKEKLNLLSNNNHDLESLKDLHRAVHSLKGEGLAIGFDDIGLESKNLEKILRDYLETNKALNSETLKIVKVYIEKIDAMLKII